MSLTIVSIPVRSKQIRRGQCRTETAVNETDSIRIHWNGLETQNSPIGPENAMPEPTIQWRRVSPGDGDVSIPWNAPVEVLGWTLAFGEVESRDEAIAPVVEGETACDGDGNVDVDGTTSGGNVDSIWVEVAWLAGESQRMCYSRRTRTEDLLVSPVPPIHHAECPYGPARHRCRHGRIKFTATKVSQMHKVETAYLECMRGTQPRGNPLKQTYGVIGPKRQRGRIKIESRKLKIEHINNKKAQDGETTHWIHACTMQPLGNASRDHQPSKHFRKAREMRGTTGAHNHGQDEALPYGSEGEEYDRRRVNEVETTDGAHIGDRECEATILCGFEADLVLACKVHSRTLVKKMRGWYGKCHFQWTVHLAVGTKSREAHTFNWRQYIISTYQRHLG